MDVIWKEVILKISFFPLIIWVAPKLSARILLGGLYAQDYIEFRAASVVDYIIYVIF